jgi:hypothetical protein
MQRSGADNLVAIGFLLLMGYFPIASAKNGRFKAF